MQAIVIKYIQLFCVAVLFDNVSCDQMLLKNYKDDLLFHQTTSCTASCLKNDVNKTLKFCYDHCESKKFIGIEPEYIKTTNYKIKLLCRDDSTLVVKIVDNEDTDDVYEYDDEDENEEKNESPNNSTEISNIFQYPGIKGTRNLYMVKVEHGNILSEKSFYIADSPLVQIENLLANVTYYITGTVMNSNSQYTNTIEPEPIHTLAKNYRPENVPNVHLSEFKLSQKSNDTLEVLVSWEPAYDQTCYYHIYSYAWELQNEDMKPYEMTKPELLYQHTISNLSFGSAYAFGVRAVNTKDNDFTSETTWINVTTPTCWEWYTNDTNLEICPPFKPKNIAISTSFISQNYYCMNISWDTPERQPSYYSLLIIDYNNTSKFNISGDQTFASIENIEINGSIYEVNLTAFSSGGSTSSVAQRELDRVVVTAVTANYQTLTLILYIGGPILAIILMVVFFVSFINFRARCRRRRYREEYFEGLDKDRPTETGNKEKQNLLEVEIKKSFLNDGMEIDEKDLKMLDVIGEGAFGFVTRAILLPSGKEVAVKMLKNVATFDVMQNFCQEVEVMRSVDKHPNIVGIVGHCMKDIEKMMLLTEYCSEGNLLDFLRNMWQRLMKCPVTNYRSNREFSFQKPTESEFNFGSSIPEKNVIKLKKIDDDDHDDELPEYNIKNLIVNKLYDEFIENNNLDSKPFYTHECNNSCKSYVDIIDESPMNTTSGEDKVNRISVKDCDCKENRKNKALNQWNRPITIVENRGYDADNNIKTLSVNNTSERTLTKTDLLSFALQIATGMEFLSFNKVVHRDLAARNVCVCSDLTVKIADFGLSRDIYQENVYKKSSDGKLPIKWLALESMTFQMYTSQSDVWSYGILLYEIVTLGSTPYPSVQTGNLLKLLMSGYRMEKPPNCDDRIYELMLSCWKTVPGERPTFTEIKTKLEKILSEIEDDQHIHNKMFDENLRSIVSSDESYLKPI